MLTSCAGTGTWRYCINPRIHFALRTIAPSGAPNEGKAILQSYDAKILAAFESVIGLAPGALSTTELLQTALPVPMGGFGLPRATSLWRAGYYGCVGATLHSVVSSNSRDGLPCLPGPATADQVAALPAVGPGS